MGGKVTWRVTGSAATRVPFERHVSQAGKRLSLTGRAPLWAVLENKGERNKMLAREGAMNDQAVSVQKRKWNWRIWLGFLIALLTIPVYAAVFARYPITRDVPWASWLMLTVAAILVWIGVKRAFANPQEYRGKIAGPAVGVLTLIVAVLFGYGTVYATKQLPASSGAPQVGSKAPDFTLSDATGKMMSLSALLTEPLPGGAKPRGVALIFYRGYW